MSICVNISGIIKYKETPKNYPSEELRKYDKNVAILEKGTLFQVEKGYMRHFVIDYIKKYLQDNIANIEGAQFTFNNFEDEDVPSTVSYEVWENKLHEYMMMRHIPVEWFLHTQDSEWLSKIYNKDADRPDDIKWN